MRKYGRKYPPAKERMFGLVKDLAFLTDEDCWIYTGSKTMRYGHVRVGKKSLSAHRISYELFRGPVPDGLHVCHKCDQTKCINPSHLFVGTIKDNAEDRQRKGRGWKKVSEEQKAEIVPLRKCGLTFDKIGKRFGLSVATVVKHYNLQTAGKWRDPVSLKSLPGGLRNGTQRAAPIKAIAPVVP